VAFTTSAVVDGVCYGYVFYDSQLTKTVLGVYYFLFFYVFMLLLFVCCYGRILVAIRRQARVMAGHTAVEVPATNAGTQPTAAGQTHSHKIQSNVVKTMILVCVFYAVIWLHVY